MKQLRLATEINSDLSGVPNQINTVRLTNEIIELFDLSGVPITDVFFLILVVFQTK